MKWEDVPQPSEDFDGVAISVRAPACPVDDGATWRQLIVSVALVVFMGWLAFSSLATDPIAWMPALLALVGVAGGLFMLIGGIVSRIRRR